MYGKTVNAVRQMNEQFRERLPSKSYLALVAGVPESTGSACDWMRKIADVAKAELCSENDQDAKRAVLRWSRLQHSKTHALLKVQLETGRMHQIRLQLASRGYPIVGDELYAQDLMRLDRMELMKVDCEMSQTHLQCLGCMLLS